ncbi:EAL domain-containing protein [Neiella marina]|uniref:EAL domain-containing protein n=1 Tax=Neiella holothuriorum TaxID=2870530 RepID=A0ABS7EE12_9GAMM|nr:EAL domain-containing protein [Neiella holothuriorum]MBW8190061.1 EAL domain-containing protein [Neiella holothuriorum]
MAVSSDDAPFVFAEEPEQGSSVAVDRACWRILVIDDDDEVHKVTRLALGSELVLERTLEFSHAYSAKDARKLLMEHDDFAVILLDVVMETDNAGLELVAYIREHLSMNAPRIILRTGQPGYAPEHQVIQDYDINDYATKTELTQRRLLTLVTTAIRSYRQIKVLNTSLVGLELTVRKARTDRGAGVLSEFANSVLTQVHDLIGSDIDGAFVCQDTRPAQIDGIGGFADQALPEELSEQIAEVMLSERTLVQDNVILMNVNCSDLPSVLVIRTPLRLRRIDQQVLESYLAHVRVAFVNLALLRKLHDTAFVDDVTRLPNRASFITTLDDLVANKQPEDKTAALLDISHFADINDSLGQDFGDDTLIAIADALSAQLSHPDVECARLNADVFGIVGPAEQVSPERIMAVFEQPLAVRSHQLPLRVRIGLCRLSDMHKDGLTVLHQCSIALSQAKRSKAARFNYFEADYEVRTQERLDIIRRLRQAVTNNALQVWYQPQLDLASGRTIGVEALLRWQDNGNFISPAVFIPLAEYSGMITEIGHWVLRQACADLSELTALQMPVRVAVNISMQQFRQDDFLQQVTTALAENRIAPANFELEITESVVMDDPTVVIGLLEQVRQLGVQVAIDDFGTGYSSLSYLKQLPLNTIKIDRAFVMDIEKEEVASIIDMVIGLAERLNLTVVAEGIETDQQKKLLTEMGCHCGQGYLFAKPMPFADLKKFLNAFRPLDS